MRFVSNNLIVPEGWPPLWDRPEPVPLFFFFFLVKMFQMRPKCAPPKCLDGTISKVASQQRARHCFLLFSHRNGGGNRAGMSTAAPADGQYSFGAHFGSPQSWYLCRPRCSTQLITRYINWPIKIIFGSF